ncbi:MAG: hypothetical protein ACREN3_01305 [Gemmatimonadaceae bacterium]
MNVKRVTQPRVEPTVYFKFQELCEAHGVAVERAIEGLMREAVERAEVNVEGKQ